MDLKNYIARPRNLNRQLKDLEQVIDLENHIARPRNLNWQLKNLGRAIDLKNYIACPSIILSCSPLGSSFYC